MSLGQMGGQTPWCESQLHDLPAGPGLPSQNTTDWVAERADITLTAWGLVPAWSGYGEGSLPGLNRKLKNNSGFKHFPAWFS